MRVLIIGDVYHTKQLEGILRQEGMTPEFVNSRQLFTAPADALEADIAIVGADHGDHRPVKGYSFLQGIPRVIPITGENIAAGIATVPEEDVRALSLYFGYGGKENLENAARYLRRMSGEKLPLPAEPVKTRFASIYSVDGRLYDSREEFLQAQGRTYPVYVGMLSYRSRWTDADMDTEYQIIRALHDRNIGVIAAYSESTPDREIGCPSFEEAAEAFFCQEGRPVIALLINFQFFGIKGGDGQSMFDRAAAYFAGLGIPVLRPTGSNGMGIEDWKTSKNPLASELVVNYQVPELQGMMEPVFISCGGGKRTHLAIPERISRLAGRVEKWVGLRCKPNREKRIVLILHNAVCSGVEATIGQASDLDAFESVVQILKRMRDEGYTLGDIPEDGEALYRQIMDRKAYSDFRWTSAEDIQHSGGVLYAMPKAEYEAYYQGLSQEARDRMGESWGAPPGEAMVLDGRLLITGIAYGNVAVMVQPKRGCYGAKCTGEVCKILQDPHCPPTHQYLASYWYMEHRFKADGCIHVGTHGSLEFLPGKITGLGGSCFSDAALGSLPNLYLYNTSATAEALVAKRRSYAVTLGHLPSPGSAGSRETRELAAQIKEYLDAKGQELGQAEPLREAILEQAANLPAAKKILDREEEFDVAVGMVRDQILRSEAARRGARRHIFGAVPSDPWMEEYIQEVWLSDQPLMEQMDSEMDPVERGLWLSQWIAMARQGQTPEENPLGQALTQDAARLMERLKSSAACEMESLMRALSGGYVSPGPAGDAMSNGRGILPAGRNLYGVETDKIPTKTAYKRGEQAAKALLAAYEEDAGRIPEKIAMNLISMDIARTGGEQMSQFLSLLGVRPIWDGENRVIGLRPVPLEELKRPRIDVTGHVSSVMRDAWPSAIALLDRAVHLVADLDEPETINYVRKNARTTGEARIFGGAPGTYTNSVGLALKASAWKDERDLARYFIDSSSYVYGDGKHGEQDVEAFVSNVRQIDVSCDITSSRKTDGGASSYSARMQGGLQMAARLVGGKEIRQYMGESSAAREIRVVRMQDHVENAIADTLLNDFWREQMMEQGYSGAADLMRRIQNVFETQCVLENVSHKTLDAIAQQYFLDENMRRWFTQHNSYALEEGMRRFLELETRGKWKAEPETWRKLKSAYLQAEGDLEDAISGFGEIQAGNVDIITDSQMEQWAEKLKKTDEEIGRWNR